MRQVCLSDAPRPEQSIAIGDLSEGAYFWTFQINGTTVQKGKTVVLR
ncbi:MAG: hypothetical protein IPL33_15865 [Sphingobacteriales bacterium]|nr:hypothetical protein [Sphingobacteriales bacterium]